MEVPEVKRRIRIEVRPPYIIQMNEKPEYPAYYEHKMAHGPYSGSWNISAKTVFDPLRIPVEDHVVAHYAHQVTGSEWVPVFSADSAFDCGFYLTRLFWVWSEHEHLGEQEAYELFEKEMNRIAG